MKKTNGTLRDIMTTQLKVIRMDTPFEKIKEIFDQNSFHHLPVVDSMNMIKGIVSRNDFTKLTYQISTNTGGKIYSQKFYSGTFAHDIMTKNVVVLNPENTIELAASLMMKNLYHAIPVMEDGVLVGIVTSHDLLVYAYYDTSPVGNS